MTYDNEAESLGTTSVTAMFDSQADAQRAVDRLVQAGIPSGRIRQVAGGADNTTQARTDDRDKGFWDSLGDFFFPDEDRYTYAEGLSRGGYLVTVTGLTGAEYDTALDILDDEGSVNLEEREQSWRSEGWGGYEASSYASGSTASGYGARTETDSYAEGDSLRGASLRTDRDPGDEETIPVVEERIRIGKRETGHGRVRVRAYTVEEPVNESVELREERVEIERRPVDRALTGTEAAFQDRTIEAEEYREEAVVQKEARVVEEIGLRKTSDTHTETISDTVRRTEVEIDKDGTDGDRDTLSGGTRRDDLDRI
ncbi:YsnF/AvaK domain-containing protein [Paracoccus yeei]|uniref:YsnF/AvaK domain-containing protein n=1 Tax=Paracoccus yeei TaxID=147645 RepID=UPI001DD3D1BF|nr:YsnF/AvaK domain-containing protein [Paracoccus yeei]MBY0135070.1 YsnF/AvaK domain-containing protein [Paracoccus yeei]